MYSTSVFWLFVVLLCHANKSGALFESDSENVMIETTDITVEYKEGGKIKLMEAYRSTKNDLILRNNKNKKLELVSSPRSRNSSHFSSGNVPPWTL